MDPRRIFNLENPKDVEYLTQFMITDEMAEHSEAEGDEDAEDYLSTPRGSQTPIFVRSHSVASPSTSSVNLTVPNLESEQTDDYQVHLSEKEKEKQAEMGQSRRISFDNDENEEDTTTTDSDEDYDKFVWTKTSCTPQQYSNYNFSQPFGITQDVQIDISSPIQIFMTVITEDFLQYIVDQSNIYGLQQNNRLDLSVRELKAFIGMLIIMGLHPLPSMRLYWSNDPNFFVTRIAEIMPVKRFLKILRLLHLNDNAQMPKKGQDNYDKLYKIRPIIKHLDSRFKTLFKPSRFLSIDESMVKFKGRSTIKQYMPMKPIKRGFKIWVIACAVTGYCLGLSVYEGAEPNADKSISLGERVVTNLAQAFQGMGYCLFFDNFFSSVVMVRRLLQKKFFCCATIRQTRKFFPKSKLAPDSAMKVTESDGASSGEIGISKWKDRGKKSVCVVSSIHNPMENTQVLRTQPDGSRKLVNCPVSIKDYNNYMGGVDHFDQLHSAYNIGWKSRRWWLKIFYYCIDACVVNSYILYKTTLGQINNKAKPLSQLQFRSALATDLVGNYSGRVKHGPTQQVGRGRKRNRPDGRPTIMNATRLVNVGVHLPRKIKSYRRCAYCSTSEQQKRSNVLCIKCDVALCIDCFVPFHTL